MHAIAAVYEDDEAAQRALTTVRERLGLPGDALQIARFASYGTPDDGRPLLAAVVPEAKVDEAHEALAATGGRVVEARVV